ncbi:histidine kinase [Paenibacillus sp. HB172176]|uniref:sensor histidine kinase n=1 Tax=Paenibacillus sp. HB172176 TaxID=2493690 RepID=UPI001439726A|nr:histidine kinase [Paenibacillus sp. HB172176]
MLTKRKSIRRLFMDRTILTKLIVTLLIVIAPLYIFNYYVNDIGARKNRQEIERTLTGSVQAYQNILDNEFLKIQQLLKQRALDIAIAHAEIIGPDLLPVERTGFLRDVRTQLSSLQYSTSFISETEAYLPLFDLVITVSDEGIKPFDSVAFETLKKQGKPFVAYRDNLYMNLPFITDSADSSRTGMFILAVQISEDRISSYLSKIMNYNRGEALLFDRNNSWHIGTGREDEIGATIRSELLSLNQERFEPHVVTRVVDGEPYLIIYQVSSDDTILAAYAPVDEIYEPVSIYKKFFAAMSFLSIVIIVLFSTGLYRLIHKPLKSLVQAFRKVELGQLQYTLVPQSEDEFGYLYRRFNTMTETLNDMIHVAYEQKLLQQRSELKRLQSQINPHFLYNNLFVLQRLIRSKRNDEAMRIAEYLGRYFQFVTRNSLDEITLEEELLHAKTYVDIQAICFEQRVTVIFEPVPDEIKKMMIPRLIVQPLLENCFIHVFEKELVDGVLSVSYYADVDFVRISVEDSGTGEDPGDGLVEKLRAYLVSGDQRVEESTGIINVHRRLQLKYGEESGLRIDRGVLGGLNMQIVIRRG